MNFEWFLFGLRLGATAILYSFLGVALYIVWQDLKLAARRQPLGTAYQLRVVESADITLSPGRAIPLEPVMVLGSAPDSHLVVTPALARHARLVWENGRWWLESFSQPGDTLLNNSTILKPVPLEEGDVIRLAGTDFKFEKLKT